jgi:hypothetical protein
MFKNHDFIIELNGQPISIYTSSQTLKRPEGTKLDDPYPLLTPSKILSRKAPLSN